VLLGVLMQFGVAVACAARLLFLVTRSAWLRSVLDSRDGVLKVAVVYGPMIWIVMSVVVIPLLTRRPVAITGRWWIQLAGHVVFVGVPIVWSIWRGSWPPKTPIWRPNTHYDAARPVQRSPQLRPCMIAPHRM